MHAPYAISDHWALTTSYLIRREKDIYNSGSNGPFDHSRAKYKRNLVELDGGYFISLNKNKTIIANLYAGTATGKFLIDDHGEIFSGTNYIRYHKSHISKWFFHPSLNFLPSKNVRLALILKSSYVHFGNITTSYTDYELQYFKLDQIACRTVIIFLSTSRI